MGVLNTQYNTEIPALFDPIIRNGKMGAISPNSRSSIPIRSVTVHQMICAHITGMRVICTYINTVKDTMMGQIVCDYTSVTTCILAVYGALIRLYPRFSNIRNLI